MILFLPSERLNKYWFFKYKLYHFLFWALYHFLWGVAEFSLLDVIEMLFHSSRYMLFIGYVIIHTLAVYFTLYYLLPNYLEKGRNAQFVGYLFLCIVVTSWVIMGSYFAVAYLTHKPLYYYCAFASSTGDVDFYRTWITILLPHSAGAILLGLSIKLINNWSLAQQQQQALEKEKLETELKFLRSQFNPHFLFNTINSIFFLIQKDQKMASNALGRFSELLRYQLYDCNEKQIPVSREISFLQSFITLEKYRKTGDLNVGVEIDTSSNSHLMISPFILMTFVENAFKHVAADQQNQNWIEINLSFKKSSTMVFVVANSSNHRKDKFRPVVHYGGIGLKNVRRRLDLLYPDQHQLKITETDEFFSIELEIKLKDPEFVPATIVKPELVSHV